jgi:RNA polymerase sigma-70 factor, ECF subfamily
MMNTPAFDADIGVVARENATPACPCRASRRATVVKAKDDCADADRHWSQWMAAAQRGDRLAYDRLLRDVVPYIRAIAFRDHRSTDRVDEVVQNVLLTVHRVRHTYDPTRPFRQWLASIARRRSIDALRSLGRRAAYEVAADTAGLVYERYADPAANRHEDAHATADYLNRAINDLPARQREAIELLKLRQLSLAEASAKTGRTIAALKVNTHRAIKSLRNQLQQG